MPMHALPSCDLFIKKVKEVSDVRVSCSVYKTLLTSKASTMNASLHVVQVDHAVDISSRGQITIP